MKQEARGLGVKRALCLKMYEFGVEEKVRVFFGILMGKAMALGFCKKFGGEKVSTIYPYLYGVKSKYFKPK